MIEQAWEQITRVTDHVTSIPVGTEEYDRTLNEWKTLIEIQNLVSPSYRKIDDPGMRNLAIAFTVIGSVGMASAILLALNAQAKKPLTLKFESRKK